MNQEKVKPIYITGHIHPDTDSIASAIGYAFLKTALGYPAVACRLGKVNRETQYLLDRFGFNAPQLLEDARIQIRDIVLDAPYTILEDTTIFNALEIMNAHNYSTLGVIDEDKKLLGLVSKSDISTIGLGDTALGIDLLKHTSIEAMNRTLQGTLIYQADYPHINGKVSITALSKDKVKNYEIKDRIVIIGDDPLSQEELIRKGAGLLIIVWSDSVSPSVLKLAKEYHCSIILSGYGCMNTSRYLYFSVPVSLIMSKDIIYFQEDELAEEVGQKMLQTRYRSYPVLDQSHRLVGFVSRFHIMNYTNKKLILVDHNEFSQSVQGIDKAELLEVVDHHRICDFATSRPVSFRNEIVGSTATIISTIFKENQIPVPKDLAGLLLGAIISDTLNFLSPTTTQKDIDVANMLSAFAQLDIHEFATDIFTISSNIADKSLEELINTDIKAFDIHGRKIMVSQVLVPCVDYVYQMDQEIDNVLHQLIKQQGLDDCIVAFTSVLENGSVFYSAGKHPDWITQAFPNELNQSHSLQKEILSRKNQIIPMLTKKASAL